MKNEKYFKEVLKRFDQKVKAMKSAVTPQEVSACERELSMLMNELQMALPRLGEDVYVAARDRRNEILKGV